MSGEQVELLQAAIRQDLPQPWAKWPGGYPNEVEAALIDAVLSIRAVYGDKASTGVRGAVGRYRDAVGGRQLNDLARLATFSPGDLQEVLHNHQNTSGVPKAKAIVDAAQALAGKGVTRADDVVPEEHGRVYTSVHGLGKVTWEYLTMLLGHPGIKADTWITRWVSEVVHADNRLSSKEARDLLAEAASGLGIGSGDPAQPTLTQLDHAIWKVARGR